MQITDKILDYVSDACASGSRIILILKNGEGWYEGVVERMYDGSIIQFATSIPGRAYSVTGFVLVTDILEVIY
jgi:hypothetical protein